MGVQTEDGMDPRKRKKRSPVVLGQATALVRTEVDYTAVNPESFAYCRMLAAELYVHSEVAMTVRELHQRPEFRHLGLATMELWCTNDRWSERRKALQEAIRKRVESSMATELARARIEQLRQLLSIREKFNAVGMLTNDKGEIQFKMEPKSLEGWMAVLIKLDAHIDKLQGAVAAILPAQAASAVLPIERSSGLSPTLKPRLTEEESLELALKLRDIRMQQDNAEVEKWHAEENAEHSVATKRKKKPPA